MLFISPPQVFLWVLQFPFKRYGSTANLPYFKPKRFLTPYNVFQTWRTKYQYPMASIHENNWEGIQIPQFWWGKKLVSLKQHNHFHPKGLNIILFQTKLVKIYCTCISYFRPKCLKNCICMIPFSATQTLIAQIRE